MENHNSRIEMVYTILSGDDQLDRACKTIPESLCTNLPRDYIMSVLNGAATKLAEQVASCGADSIITYHSHKKEADSVVSEIEAQDQRAVALQLDVGDIKSFDGFIQQVSHSLKDKWGRDNFDFLINNAGIGAQAAVEQMTEAVFDGLFNIHFKGVYFLTQKVIPLFLK